MNQGKKQEKDYLETLGGDVSHLKADIKLYFSNFTSFIQDRIVPKKEKDFILLIFITGASSVVLNKFTGWSAFATAITLAGIFGGFFSYYLQGLFYKVGVALSGGKIEWATARKITLFTGLPVSIVTLLPYVLNVLVYGESSVGIDAMPTPLDYVGFLLLAVFLCLSVVFGYRAARIIGGTSKIRSIIFFVVIPVLCTLLMFLIGMSIGAY